MVKEGLVMPFLLPSVVQYVTKYSNVLLNIVTKITSLLHFRAIEYPDVSLFPYSINRTCHDVMFIFRISRWPRKAGLAVMAQGYLILLFLSTIFIVLHSLLEPCSF